MSVLYADTSVILRAYFADEQEHETLRSLLFDGDEPVVTSEIARLEVASAAAAAVRAGRIPVAAVIVAAFDADCGDEGALTLLRLEPTETLSRAVALVQQHRLNALDAIHVAVALSVARSVGSDDLTFVTRGLEQAKVAAALGLRIR